MDWSIFFGTLTHTSRTTDSTDPELEEFDFIPRDLAMVIDMLSPNYEWICLVVTSIFVIKIQQLNVPFFLKILTTLENLGQIEAAIKTGNIIRNRSLLCKLCSTCCKHTVPLERHIFYCLINLKELLKWLSNFFWRFSFVRFVCEIFHFVWYANDLAWCHTCMSY